MERPQDLSYQLMDFRTSYLRAVARATVDLEFRKVLTDPCINPLDTLKEYFNYKCPWDLTLVLKDDPERAPRVNVANGTVMTQPYRGEQILIYIPDKPKGEGCDCVMEALAAYYDLTPFLLPDRTQPERSYAPVTLPDHPDEPTVWASVDMYPGTSRRFDLGVEVENFIAFAAVMFNAVALTWENHHFRNLLTNGASGQSAINLLKEWLGYKYPWEMDLQVRIDEHATFPLVEEPRDNSIKKYGKWIIKSPQLTLTLPMMTGAVEPMVFEKETDFNKKDPRVAIMGLTLYNTDGPGYPFTCG